jgi:hypothetical protein
VRCYKGGKVFCSAGPSSPRVQSYRPARSEGSKLATLASSLLNNTREKDPIYETTCSQSLRETMPNTVGVVI